MPLYFVTGKLGSGKTLLATSKIRDRLNDGLLVATNLDINLKNMIGIDKKNTRLIRVPDKPTAEDLYSIGIGNKTYDESKNGLLVLDECGTWFNSREWGDKSRQHVINWFLHARKLGWDVIFLVQDLSMVDKQARVALAEHVVYCRRTDRLNIPFIGAIFNLIFSSRLPLPKIHIGIVKYGESPTALKVDTWSCYAPGLYNSYDTKQKFSDFYEHGVYSVLPPYLTYGRHRLPITWSKFMRLTKIYFKSYSRPLAFILGFLFCSLAVAYVNKDELKAPKPVDLNPLDFSQHKIVSYINLPNQKSKYIFQYNDQKIKSTTLENQGYEIKDRGNCEALIVKGGQYASIYCN